jgi:hypothetical protein
LTPEVQQKIVAFVRAGSYDWVAAEANGVDRQTFWEWIRRGEGREHPDRPPTDLYANFAKEVREARAQARSAAEVEVRQANPEFWLRCGPGKERPGEPGWTERPAQLEMPHVTIVVTDGWRA